MGLNKDGIEAKNNKRNAGAGNISMKGNNSHSSDYVAYTTGPGYSVTGNNNLIFFAYVIAHEGNGIEVSGQNNTICDNFIGVDEYGAAAGNEGDGIALECASETRIYDNDIVNNLGYGVSITTSENTLVGEDGAGGNLIADNGEAGVLIDGESAGNAVVGNSIWDNGGPGIESDSPYPVLYTDAGGNGHLLDSGTANTWVYFQYYASNVAVDDGEGGMWNYQSIGIWSGSSGEIDTFITSPIDGTFRWIEVTATELTSLSSYFGGGNTSQFSNLFVVPAGGGGGGLP